MWISHKYTYIPSLLNLPPALPVPPLYVVKNHWAELPVLNSSFLLHMVMYIFQCYSLNLSHCLFWCVHGFILYVYVSITALHIGSSVPFSRFHIYVLIFIFLFLTYFTLYKGSRVHPSQLNWLKFIPFYDWVIFHCIYTTISLSILLSMDI